MRKRRIIYDVDDCGNLPTEVLSPENGIISTINEVVGTQVDTICWTVGAVNMAFMTYDTKVGEIYAVNDLLGKNLASLLAKGTDPLRIAIEEGHKNNIEVFANFRLNDTHHWSDRKIASKFWKEHYPEYRVKGVKGWGCVEGCLDYSFPEVRKKQLEVVYDIATRYDIDGFHLDFMRNPPFFSPRYARKKAPILTQFVIDVKEILTKIGIDKNKDIPLSARIRKNILLCEEAGMDIKTWIKKELFEFIAPGESNDNDFNIPVAEFKKIIRDTNIGLYPCICNGYYNLNSTPEQYRAYALNCYQEGADGVFLFNLFCYLETEDSIPRELLFELGSSKTIDKKKKRHYIFFAYAGLPDKKDKDSILTHIYNEQYNNLPVCSRKNKKIKKTLATISIGKYPHLKIGRQKILLPGTWAKIMFKIADTRGRLCFKLAGMAAEDEMKLKINNIPIERGKINEEYFPAGRSGHPIPIPPYYQYCLKVNGKVVNKGMNELKVFVLPRAKGLKTDIKMWELEVIVE